MKNVRTTLPVIALLFSGTLFLIGCEKYEEGGSLNKAEKRLTSVTWELEKYLRNGNDETSELLISQFSETFAEDGSLTRAYIDKDDEAFSETGSWVFDNDKQQINLTGVSSVELTDETSTVSSSDYNILKLVDEELWYTYENGGDSHEFHLVPKE